MSRRVKLSGSIFRPTSLGLTNAVIRTMPAKIIEMQIPGTMPATNRSLCTGVQN
jgi:hypothetical protein